MSEDAIDLDELAKRRGFYFQANEAYGGVAGLYTYGPQGAALKRNIEDTWRDRFVLREGNMEIDAPTVTPEPVFVASGHLDGFDDMIVECGECGAPHRADHLVEDNSDIEDAETYPTEEVAEIIADLDIECPNCGASLAGRPVEEFNLMFETSIGPGSGQPGYLRPETAQGMFVEFPRLKEYARNQLPFGVAQIGAGYRNEISPRNALLRAREFTMAELEFFIDPETDEPDLAAVADVELPLYPIANQQADDTEYVHLTPQEALDEGLIEGEWVAYFVAVSKRWFDRIGVDMDRFRFRQHLPGERAHYAADCWDAEALIGGVPESNDSGAHRTWSGGDWVELEGVASRTDYDLSKHEKHADDDFRIFKQYDEPKTVERATVDPDMSYLGPEFGGQASDIADALETLAGRDRDAFDADEVTVSVDGEDFTVPTETVNFSVDVEEEHGYHVMPHVIEPAFGVGRAVYTVLAHAYEADEVEGETRHVLRLNPEVAPTFAGVFPLVTDGEIEETAREITSSLRARGLGVEYDDSGSIGRRYRRQDEVGTPFCVTVDGETPEDGTVTVRDRDSTEQVRLSIDELPETLSALRAGEVAFADLTDAEPAAARNE